MFKKIIAILMFIVSSFYATLSISASNPEVVAVRIMTDALSDIKDFKAQGKDTVKDVRELMATKLLPSLDINESAKQSLKKHWSELSTSQQEIIKTYVAVSLVDSYSSVLSSYEHSNSVKISANPDVKHKGNKAIVKLDIIINENPKPIKVYLKMILNDDWYIYDVVFLGVSLVENYQASFNSQIKRKGVESLIAKASKKLKENLQKKCPVCVAMNFKQDMLIITKQ
jgi:phospholipid transport system substrate-binding protein